MTFNQREEINELAYSMWEEEAAECIKGIKVYLNDSDLTVSGLSDVADEIKDFIHMSEFWDPVGDGVYDYSRDAIEMLNNLSIKIKFTQDS